MRLTRGCRSLGKPNQMSRLRLLTRRRKDLLLLYKNNKILETLKIRYTDFGKIVRRIFKFHLWTKLFKKEISVFNFVPVCFFAILDFIFTLFHYQYSEDFYLNFGRLKNENYFKTFYFRDVALELQGWAGYFFGRIPDTRYPTDF